MIKPYKESDKNQVIEIFKLNVPQYFDPKEVKDFEEYLEKESDRYFVIEEAGNIVGGVGYYIRESDRSGSISWIFFHPDSTGKGFGKQAVEHCLEIFKSNPKIEKLTVATSQLADQFFAKFGYKLIRIEKDYWGKGLDLYLMERKNYQ